MTRDGWLRVMELVRKEFIQILRDSRMRRIVIIAPLLQLIVFGYAVSTDVRDAKIFVVDLDRSRDSRELVAALTSGGLFRVSGRSERPGDLVQALDSGRALLGLEVPPGFSRGLRSGAGAPVQILVDGTNSNTALVARGYAERIVLEFAAKRAGVQPAGGVDLRERAWFNPDLASRNYNVPAVVGVITMLICLLLTSLAVVREREIGTLEQLMVSPLRPIELVAGKTIPFAAIGFLDLLLVSLVALLWFKIPFAGSAGLLVLASAFYLLAGLGMGLFVSTISRTQQEAFMASFLIFMPMILLSGFMFPVSSMPVVFRWITLLNPVRHYLEIVRGIFLKGTGIDSLAVPFVSLIVMGSGIVSFAAMRFRKTVG